MRNLLIEGSSFGDSGGQANPINNINFDCGKEAQPLNMEDLCFEINLKTHCEFEEPASWF